MGAGDPPPFLSPLRASHASVGTADVAAMHTSSMGRPCHPGEWVAAITEHSRLPLQAREQVVSSTADRAAPVYGRHLHCVPPANA